ncbi:MAG: hypothetical protein AB9897_03450 [Anaerolineaceae bacterium]
MTDSSKKRVLKIISVGEFRKKHLKAQIRLEGKWLVTAGLIPDTYVEVTNPQAGVLILRCVQE